MPRHVKVSPDEDLATFYGGAGSPSAAPPAPVEPPPVAAAATPAPEPPAGVDGEPPAPAPAEAPAPFSLEIEDPESEEILPPNPTRVPGLDELPAEPAAPVPPPLPKAAAPASAPPAPSGAPMATSLAPYTGPSPVLNAVISFFLPGLGQIFCGQTAKGATLLLLALCTGCGGGIFPILAAVDAYAITKRRAAGEPVTDWQFF